MTEPGRKQQYSENVNLVLVLGQEQEARAVLSTVVVYAYEQEKDERICITGPATFHEKTAKHLKEVVMPIVDQILEVLGLPNKNFEICVANIEASSINDIGLNISGHSLDVPILIGMISAALGIPVSKKIVSTGHIASLYGDIRMVSGLQAKLTAAIDTKSINTFLHPDLDQDGSLDSLSPNNKQHIAGDIAMAKRNLQLTGVRDINDLVRLSFSDEHIVLASLERGFYETSTSSANTDSPIGKTANFLGLKNSLRFWKTLERQLMEGRNDDVKNFLRAMADFHLKGKTYPKDFGHKLLQLMQSLPPTTRRFKIIFPLLSMTQCIGLSQFAEESDHQDVKSLFRATSGEVIGQSVRIDGDISSGDAIADTCGNENLSLVISEIDADALTVIGHPIDLARATYLLDSVTVRSYNDFVDTITSFYIHLVRHTRKISEPVDRATAGAEAIALLERAFSRNGGFNAALSESKIPVNGGLRFILDRLAEQFKMEQQEKHVNHILKSALDPLDWERKVDLMEALLKRLQSHLPADILSQSPDRFAGQYEGIVKAYVRSKDQIKSLFRSL